MNSILKIINLGHDDCQVHVLSFIERGKFAYNLDLRLYKLIYNIQLYLNIAESQYVQFY